MAAVCLVVRPGLAEQTVAAAPPPRGSAPPRRRRRGAGARTTMCFCETGASGRRLRRAPRSRRGPPRPCLFSVNVRSSSGTRITSPRPEHQRIAGAAVVVRELPGAVGIAPVLASERPPATHPSDDEVRHHRRDDDLIALRRRDPGDRVVHRSPGDRRAARRRGRRARARATSRDRRRGGSSAPAPRGACPGTMALPPCESSALAKARISSDLAIAVFLLGDQRERVALGDEMGEGRRRPVAETEREEDHRGRSCSSHRRHRLADCVVGRSP